MRPAKKPRPGEQVDICEVSAVYVPEERNVLVFGRDAQRRLWWCWWDTEDWTEMQRPRRPAAK